MKNNLTNPAFEEYDIADGWAKTDGVILGVGGRRGMVWRYPLANAIS